MTLPTKTLTLQENANQTVAAQGSVLATSRRVLRTLKNGLMAFGLAAFTCLGSSDGTTASNMNSPDNTDRWAADANLVWAAAGVAHSWIVLKSTAITSNFQLLISLEAASATGDLLTVYFSPANGFTGGSTSARPTATDEVAVVAGTGGFAPPNQTVRIHQWLSNDGKHLRCFAYSGNTLVFTLLIGVPANPQTGWTNPCWVYMASGATALNITTLCRVTTAPVKGRTPAGAILLWFTCEAWGAAGSGGCLPGPEMLTGADGQSGDWPAFGIGLASSTSLSEGRKGDVVDLWWGVATNADNTGYPDVAANSAIRQFYQLGDLIIGSAGVPGITAGTALQLS